MKHRTSPFLPTLAVLLLALSLTAASHAQPNAGPYDAAADESADAHVKRGRVAYDLQDWTTAEREYQAAYGLEQQAETLWALAQAQRQGGKFAVAMKTYKAFQRAGVTANQANAAEMMVLKCEAEIAKQEAREARMASSQPQGAAAPAAPPPPAGGPTPKPLPEPDAAEGSSGLHMAWFITGAVLTAGLGAAAVWSGTDTMSKASDYEDVPTQAAYDNGRGLEQRTNILAGATAIVGASTVLLAIFTDWSGTPEEPTEQASLRVVPAMSEGGGVLVLDGRF